MGQTAILIDGNFLFHSEFSVYTSYNKSAKFSNEKDEISFIQGVANKLFYVLNSLPKGGKVIFCVDSKSWRKQIEIEGGGYKQSRSNKDGGKGTMDQATMEKFYRLMDEFCDTLKNVGIIVSKINGAESDDLIFRWSDYFYDNGDNAIIISGDKDLTQLVKLEPFIDDDTRNWVIQWNNNTQHNKIYAPIGWNTILSKPASIFEMSMTDDISIIKQLINNLAIQIVPTNVHDVILTKIMLGDDGDDVPPAWSYPGKTKEGKDKVINLTPKILEKLRDNLAAPSEAILKMIAEDEYLQNMCGLILRIMKDVDGKDERVKVSNSVKRNKTLMMLSAEVIPEKLIEAMDEHIEEAIDNVRTQRQKWNRKGLFESTRFSENAAPKTDDPYAFFNIPG